jgi:bis(5'-nucleosyl)-tetraphosphatase (symmetrical)
MAIYAVGDIQGCYDPLRHLLDKAGFDTASDQLWCVGDFINRGPKSLETLRFLKSLGPVFTGVLGNHDLHFLAAWSGAWNQRSDQSQRANKKQGKFDTLQALLKAPDCDELAEWLRAHPLAHRATVATQSGATDFLMVHAGIAPHWTFAQTLSRANEVATALRAPNYRDYLKDMYGDEPNTFSEELHGIERLRVITNVLTRLRFCTAAGKLDMENKEDADTAAPGYRAWFEFQQLAPMQKILFGHWAMLDGRTSRADIVGLDTGCVWGRALTMLRLDDGRKFSVSCKEKLGDRPLTD